MSADVRPDALKCAPAATLLLSIGPPGSDFREFVHFESAEGLARQNSDGAIKGSRGYDEQSMLFIAPAPGLTLGQVPDEPTPASIRNGSPQVGQHNDGVFGDLLGIGHDTLVALAVEGVI